MTYTKKNAEKIWSRLKVNLLAADDLIQEIIENKLWKPLGYDTFIEAWTEKMRGVKLAEVTTARIIYQAFDEGATDMDIVGSGLTSNDSEVLQARRAHDLGVDAEHAPTLMRSRKKAHIEYDKDSDRLKVSSHERRVPSAQANVHMSFPRSKYEAWAEYAKENNLSFRSWMKDTMEQAMDEQLN